MVEERESQRRKVVQSRLARAVLDGEGQSPAVKAYLSSKSAAETLVLKACGGGGVISTVLRATGMRMGLDEAASWAWAGMALAALVSGLCLAIIYLSICMLSSCGRGQ
jgi:hypothetical protein